MHIEAWNLYFPEEQYTVYNEAIDMIKKFKEDIKSLLDTNEIERDRIFNLDYEVFSKLTQDFKDRNHETIIDCLSCAVSEVLHIQNLNLFRVRTRLLNFGDLNVEISPDNCGRLTSLVGTVCRIGFKKIVLLKAFFECTKCHEVLSVSLLNNIYSPPKKCLGTCKSRTFTFLFHHQSTIMRDVQEIKIQENNTISDEYQVKEGIDCLIYDEHVGTISPGDVLRVCGIICAENESNSLYKLVIRVNNLEHFNSKQNLTKSEQKKDNFKVGKASKDDKVNKVEKDEDKNKEVNDNNVKVNTYLVKDSDNTFITPTPIITDFDLFKKISRTVNIIPTLIHSLYPGIFGHELIKVGLLLSLFGGTRKYVGHSSIRSEIHTLIIGDPGLGKSRMLLGSCTVLPKSTYISGNLATTAGLTVSLTHDPQTGDFMADAGALVVADNGVCCMDEFDKIDDHSALFEAMEEQKVTVAKGGVVCSIPTRATIIAASNPKYGHFNKSKSIRENLRFDNALLSRFDLIFILVDDLNEKENYEISDQILKKRRQSTEGDFINTGSNFSLDLICSSLRTDPFLKNLSKPETLIPLEQVRKYINYARNSVFPVLSTAAKEEIKKFYLEIRVKKSITTRDLESLIRLTESRAKIELRSIATREDAGFAIDLYKRVLKREDVKNKSKKGNLKDLVEEIKNKNEILTKNELVGLIKEFELNKPVDEIIETLNYKGVIIKKGNNEYKVV